MKILLAYDGSPPSEAALAEVARRPWPAGSEVLVVSVEPPVDPNLLRTGMSEVYDSIVEEQRRQMTQRLNQAVGRIRDQAPDLGVTARPLQGTPKDEILDEAERWQADLIMLGSHGYGALKRLFLGSVSLAVATGANCSVEIVRAPQQDDQPAGD